MDSLASNFKFEPLQGNCHVPIDFSCSDRLTMPNSKGSGTVTKESAAKNEKYYSLMWNMLATDDL